MSLSDSLPTFGDQELQRQVTDANRHTERFLYYRTSAIAAGGVG